MAASASASVASKFAVALHRRTHRVTSALAYAVLEWILIALLLIDGLFAYAIARFADHFGLRPPCLLCSRLDRLFQVEDGEEAGGARWLRGVLCGAHAAEISRMGYCLCHRRLADAADMCEGCLPSWEKERRNDADEKGAVVCSCCEAVVEISSLELDDTREDPVYEKTSEEEEGQGYVLLGQEDHEEEEDEQEQVEEQQEQHNEEEGQDQKVADVDDESFEFMAGGEEIDPEDDRLVPVVALDEITVADDSGWHRDAGEDEGDINRIDNELDPDDLDIGVISEVKRMLASSVAAMIEKSSAVPIPCEETLVSSSDPDENLIPQDDEVVLQDTVEIGDSRAEGEDMVVPQVGEAAPEGGNRSSEVEINCDNEAEEDKTPETPTYSFARTQSSDRKFLLERKRSLSLSLDGSVSSEIESGVEPSTIDQLKSTLQAERKALSAMYAELEEERSAAAVATNQTMAMINRLQEEKAAMQMEALQYQRMMEEQSEYDQEALQLLTELVTKREREKQELERELELCRHKVRHYEDKERRRTASFKDSVHSPNGNGSSGSSSGDDDTDEHSDDYCELGEFPVDGGDLQSSSDAALSPRTDQENTEHLVALDDSLTYFEMERLSILEELKALEERLFTLEDDDMNDDTNAGAGHSLDDHELSVSADGLRSPANGLTGDDKPKYEGRNPIRRGKSLLPLFDAAGDETPDRESSATVGHTEADDSTTKPVSVFTKERERVAIIEEVDHVYERLQALEADKEFLRHCIKSLKKGEKGMYLLQEILQHLRELRSVELHVKNAGDALSANSA